MGGNQDYFYPHFIQKLFSKKIVIRPRHLTAHACALAINTRVSHSIRLLEMRTFAVYISLRGPGAHLLWLHWLFFVKTPGYSNVGDSLIISQFSILSSLPFIINGHSWHLACLVTMVTGSHFCLLVMCNFLFSIERCGYIGFCCTKCGIFHFLKPNDFLL